MTKPEKPLSTIWFLLLMLFFATLSWRLAGLRLNPSRDFHPLKGSLRVGWVENYPYQMTQLDRSFLRRDGLSYRIVEACLDQAGYQADFINLDWSSQLKALENGEIDVMMMAAKTAERERFALFSQTYLHLDYSAFTAPNQLPLTSHLSHFSEQTRQYRISATRGAAYPRPIRELIEKARQQNLLTEVAQESENLEMLATGQADLTFLDELTGFSIIRDYGWEGRVGYQNLDLPKTPLHVMFSRKTVTPEAVAQFDLALQDLRQSGQQARLVRNYYFPRLLGLLTQHKLFRILAISGAIFAGLTGVLMARREGYDLVGALALAGCPAVGGSIMRDLVAGRSPLGVVADPVNLLAVAILVGLGWLFFRLAPKTLRDRVEALDPSQDPRLVFLDSLGLGSYTVLSVLTAMQTNCEPLWLWGPMLAIVQNGGGGILRDLLRGKGGQIAILKGTIYGEIAACWALLLAFFFLHQSTHTDIQAVDLSLVIVAALAGVVATRSLVVARGWKSPAY